MSDALPVPAAMPTLGRGAAPSASAAVTRADRVERKHAARRSASCLDDQRQGRLGALERSLVAHRCAIRLNGNQRVLISLRHRRGMVAGRAIELVLSLHHDLLDHPEALAHVPAWVAARGRRMDPVLRQALTQVFHTQRRVLAPPPAPDLPTLGEGGCDLDALLDQVHSRWFPSLPRPIIRWSRASPQRRLRHIRFGCYRRRPVSEIQLNPRLNQPWVALAFVEHVVFHELCHHAQACQPVRGETPHSRRFRAWEQAYPQHHDAQAWERANLHRLLDPEAADQVSGA
jgi:hypothetical protein